MQIAVNTQPDRADKLPGQLEAPAARWRGRRRTAYGMTIENLKAGVKCRAGKAARVCIASLLTHCSPAWPSPRSQKHPCDDAPD